jgi:sarcosine oxidase subunit delta
MLLIPCPYCGDRPELEFHYGGEAHIARSSDPDTLDDAAWEDFLYLRTNPKGLHTERWWHVHGCARFFNAVRNTATDHFSTSYKIADPRPNPTFVGAKE